MDPPPPQSEDKYRNWLELPRDLTASILKRLDAIEILTRAQKVCLLWRNICKDPSMWRVVDMRSFVDLNYNREKVCRHVLDRSCGQLVEISIKHFATDDLLKYIADSSSLLRCLRLVDCYIISDKGLSEVALKLPLLEELEISYCSVSVVSLRVFGRCCPFLKSLKFKRAGYGLEFDMECDAEALTIAENMPELRCLQYFGYKLSDVGLKAILDGCPHLESLDLRLCFSVTLASSEYDDADLCDFDLEGDDWHDFGHFYSD